MKRMNAFKLPTVLVRGAGDLATGVIQALVHAGFPTVALEMEDPTAIRRTVALSSALHSADGMQRIEDITGCRVDGAEAVKVMLAQQTETYKVPIVADPEGRLIDELKPEVVVDAIIAKRNVGTGFHLAPWVIALGPGFTPRTDCDIAIETMRGHHLGRRLIDRSPQPNTGVPGNIGGRAEARVFHAPIAGRVVLDCSIGDVLKADDIVMRVVGENETAVLRAPFDGLIRGLIRPDCMVPKGMKIGDIDPRIDERDNCFTISDKARSLGGSVVCAVMMGLSTGYERDYEA